MAEGGFTNYESEPDSVPRRRGLYSRHSHESAEKIQYEQASVETCYVMKLLGYGYHMRQARRDACTQLDNMFSVRGMVSCITIGVKADGLTCFLNREWDQMYVLGGVMCLEHSLNVERDSTVFRLITSVCYPGYCRLLLERHGRMIHPFVRNALCDDGYGRAFLSSGLFVNEGSRVEHASHVVFHVYAGPAVPLSYFGEFVIDIVYSLPCQCPSILTKWAGRPRHWPSCDTVRKVVALGAYVIPAGFKWSEYRHLEWKICFSTGENELMRSLNDTQVYIYVILKMVIKDVLKPLKKEITSYTAKTIVLWLAEHNPKDMFHEGSLFHWVREGLAKLKTSISIEQLSHYMIPEHNLMAACGLEENQKRVWVATITEMLSEGPKILLRLSAIRQAIISYREPLLWYISKVMELELLQLKSCRFKLESNSIVQATHRRLYAILRDVLQRMRWEGSRLNDPRELFAAMMMMIPLRMNVERRGLIDDPVSTPVRDKDIVGDTNATNQTIDNITQTSVPLGSVHDASGDISVADGNVVDATDVENIRDGTLVTATEDASVTDVKYAAATDVTNVGDGKVENAADDMKVADVIPPGLCRQEINQEETVHAETRTADCTSAQFLCDMFYSPERVNNQRKLESECRKICNMIIELDNDNIVDVFPAYTTDGTRRIVFVVTVKNETEDIKASLNQLCYDIEIKSLELIPTVKGTINYKDFPMNDDFTEILRNVIAKHADELMLKHKYLSFIRGCNCRRNSSDVNLHATKPRIALYVRAKGLIPIDEQPFERSYDGVQVDVREGSFVLFGKHAGERHDNVRMGCQITGYSRGTLSVFFEHEEYGIFGLSCGHVLVSPDEMKKCANAGGTLLLSNNAKVYQPGPPDEIGTITKIICKQGNVSEAGLDIAVIQMNTRAPITGKFPESNTPQIDHEFDSGRAFEPKLERDACYKFGCETELTQGIILSSSAQPSVARAELDLYCSGHKTLFYNQIAVSSTGSFATFGDSGAPVFIRGCDGAFVCIGIVLGGIQEEGGPFIVVVTPITRILQELGISKLKSFSKLDKLADDVSDLKQSVLRIEAVLSRIANGT